MLSRNKKREDVMHNEQLNALLQIETNTSEINQNILANSKKIDDLIECMKNLVEMKKNQLSLKEEVKPWYKRIFCI